MAQHEKGEDYDHWRIKVGVNGQVTYRHKNNPRRIFFHGPVAVIGIDVAQVPNLIDALIEAERDTITALAPSYEGDGHE